MKLSVYVLGQKVAVLEQVGDFKSVLTYRPETAPDNLVSLTMPVRTESWVWDDQLHPIFQMNLPEGYLLQILQEQLGPHIGADPIALLSVIGRNMIGRIQIAAAGAALAASAKDRHEHQLVIDTMVDALRPLCSELTIAPTPELSRTTALWHLSTPINGRLRDTSTTAMDLTLALHPTPAVGGVPAGAAAELISTLEGDRGFYAGAVGWCDARGDGRWVVSIRCAQLAADRRTALAHAGGGIVAESDPDDEVAETTTKFVTILSALGVQL